MQGKATDVDGPDLRRELMQALCNIVELCEASEDLEELAVGCGEAVEAPLRETVRRARGLSESATEAYEALRILALQD